MSFYVEPVVGYRAWTVSTGTYELTSRIIPHLPWPSKKAFVARCEDCQFRLTQEDCPPDHEAPERYCTCGIYGWHTIQEAKESYCNGSRAILGSMVCWGKIIICTKGFRAQYARPLAITEHDPDRTELGWNSLLERVVEKYSIPFIPVDDLQAYTETWGNPMGIDYLDGP